MKFDWQLLLTVRLSTVAPSVTWLIQSASFWNSIFWVIPWNEDLFVTFVVRDWSARIIWRGTNRATIQRGPSCVQYVLWKLSRGRSSWIYTSLFTLGKNVTFVPNAAKASIVKIIWENTPGVTLLGAWKRNLVKTLVRPATKDLSFYFDHIFYWNFLPGNQNPHQNGVSSSLQSSSSSSSVLPGNHPGSLLSWAPPTGNFQVPNPANLLHASHNGVISSNNSSTSSSVAASLAAAHHHHAQQLAAAVAAASSNAASGYQAAAAVAHELGTFLGSHMKDFWGWPAASKR